MREVNQAVEGLIDRAVARRLVADLGGACGALYGGEGKPKLLERLSGYNSAARFKPWFVLVDLDNDQPCAPPFVRQYLPRAQPLMCFRVAVRAVEAWLLADCSELARFLSVPTSLVPRRPEDEPDPKVAMVNLGRRSRRRAIREGMVPGRNSHRRVGPMYDSILMEFVHNGWRPSEAARRSESLESCIQRLAQLLQDLGT